MVLLLDEIKTTDLQNLPGFKWPDICISGRWYHILYVSKPNCLGYSRVNVCPLGRDITTNVHDLPHNWLLNPRGRVMYNGYWYTFNQRAI